VTERPGFALAVSLLLIAGLAAIGAGMVLMGAREHELMTAATRRSSARTAAETAVRGALATWSTRRYQEIPVGQASEPTAAPQAARPTADALSPAVRASWTVLRLDSTLFLIHGEGRLEGPDGAADPRGALASAGALVRTLSPGALAAAFPAAVTAGRDARIDGGLVSGSGSCGAAGGAPGVLAPSVYVDPAAVVTGAPPVSVAPAPPVVDPDPFTEPLLATLVTATLEGGTVTPRPRTAAGQCDPGPLNWGAVSTSSPCHALLPFIHATGDLTVRGGEGRALLLVDGDLFLESTRFHGLILVRGRLTLGPGASIRGAVRAGTVHVRDGSLSYDACQLRDALAAGDLDRPFPHPDRLWIPLF
jgi:hypothetical protein